MIDPCESLPDCGCGPAPNPHWQTDTLEQALARPLLVSHVADCPAPKPPTKGQFMSDDLIRELLARCAQTYGRLREGDIVRVVSHDQDRRLLDVQIFADTVALDGRVGDLLRKLHPADHMTHGADYGRPCVAVLIDDREVVLLESRLDLVAPVGFHDQMPENAGAPTEVEAS